MKKNLLVALLISVSLLSCRPKVIYVDRPVSPPANSSSTAPSSNDNQPYVAPPQPAQPAYSGNTQQNNNQQYNNGGQSQYDNGSQPNSSQQQYKSDQNYQESDQQYYANQQQVNYGSPSYQTFYDELSPYGSWVNYQSYGYVWVPAQGAGFTPYATNGQWVYTQYGMTWQSGYNWGWAPFHYGSWVLDPFYGWLWVPGNTWAPAQVVWGQYNGYYGWAPMGPGYYAGYRPAPEYWNFAPQAQITQPNIHNYMVLHENNNTVINNNITNVTIVNHTGTYNNTVFNAGPQKAELEQVTGHPVQAVNVSESNKPLPANQRLTSNNLTVYRPAIAQVTATHAAPAHVVPLENVKTVNATAVHGSLPRANTLQPANRPTENTTVNPATRPNEPSPAHGMQERQSEPVQRYPAQERPQSQPEHQTESRPVQERPSTPPAQHNPNPNPNRPATSKPKPQPRPAPVRESKK